MAAIPQLLYLLRVQRALRLGIAGRLPGDLARTSHTLLRAVAGHIGLVLLVSLFEFPRDVSTHSVARCLLFGTAEGTTAGNILCVLDRGE